jgi:pyruvate dehydrogenase E1 component
MAYDPAFAYEIAVIVQDGMQRMFRHGEEIFYYITLYNETFPMPPMPEGCENGILSGLYRFKTAPSGKKYKAHLFGSGPLIREALRAQNILGERYDISADVWSATSYKQLREEALEARRWNMLHPSAHSKKSYLERVVEKEEGVFVAVSDYMKIVPQQIASWVPGGLLALGTDGFGRSDTRRSLRRFFEIDAEFVVIATLYALAQKGSLRRETVARAIQDLHVDPEKAYPFHS